MADVRQLYNSLVYIKNNKINKDELFEEYFVVPGPGGKPIELCKLGAKTKVTDTNKERYINLM